ncbi:MAG TPA: helix-turn-helix domain-containing protein [Thermoanaerobaculia bacterium]|nr:helix-turn-helix domain-containing protein [Thermoanaerobaculia bacterium]
MRSYEQYCALARALDLIGDRWTLLIVRELLIRERCRYTDLREGLPGIATNLLADRLRELEKAGIVSREEAPPPIATTLFHLTQRGKDLEPVMLSIGRWGSPLLARSARKDAFRGHWLALPVKLHLIDRTPRRPPITIEVRSGGESIVIETADGSVRTRPGTADHPDAVMTGTPQLIVDTLFGRTRLTDAKAAGLKYIGDPATLRRLQP